MFSKDQTDGFRKIPIPAHRYTPLKDQWMKIYSPVVEYLHLQIRFNLRTRCVEIKTSDQTEDIQSLQKAGKRNPRKIIENIFILLFSGFYQSICSRF
jgi:rRNA processing protein Krr1/Pno1